MTRELIFNGHRLKIDVQKNGSGDIIKLEAMEHEIICDELAPGSFMLMNSDGQYRAHVVKQKDRIFVWLAGCTFEFHIPSADEASAQGGAGSPEVRAPMPGTLIKLLVSEGDSVEEGQVVAVLEAMKMEHQLRAPLSGTVKKVTGTVGAVIEADALIVALASFE